MSGHSKWSSIRHKKSAADAKRGKVFSRLIKEVTVAARLGGGDPGGNPRLRTAIAAARAANMPADNVERAIKKGTGELPGVSYEELTLEGYGAGGVAILTQALTDNRNRTVAELRKLFTKNGGSLVEAGAVSWMFEMKGIVVVERGRAEEESLMELALEAGAEDLKQEESFFEITARPEDFESVKEALTAKGIPLALAEVTQIPKNTLRLEGAAAKQVLRLMEALEDHDDVQHAYANFDIPESVMQEATA